MESEEDITEAHIADFIQQILTGKRAAYLFNQSQIGVKYTIYICGGGGVEPYLCHALIIGQNKIKN